MGCCGGALGALVLLDDFDRADGTDMGPSWVEQSPNFWIDDGQASSNDQALMTYVGGTSTTVAVDVYHNGENAVQYAALVLGYKDNPTSIFCRVQDNMADGDYDFLIFDFGNRGIGNSNWTGGGASALWLAEPFTAARVTASLSGAVATVAIDTNFDGTSEETYSRGNVPTGLLGTGIGLGGWGEPLMDNFRAEDVIPEPATLGLLALGGLGLLRRRRTG